MTNEIKEILEALKDSINDTGTNEVNFINWVDKIEDYITNLQEYYNDNVNKYEELLVKYSNLQEENKELKNGYCELKVKCNNGECDCTNEEYESMVQSNIKGSLLLNKYIQRNEKAIEILEQDKASASFNTAERIAINILKGDKDE